MEDKPITRQKFTTTLNVDTLNQLELIKIELNKDRDTRIRGLNEVIEIIVKERWGKINDKYNKKK